LLLHFFLNLLISPPIGSSLFPYTTLFRSIDNRCHSEVVATRGANGIDGQVSTFYGLAHNAPPALAVVGDLTALYDLNAPWVLNRSEEHTSELQSRENIVCRLLLEIKKYIK